MNEALSRRWFGDWTTWFSILVLLFVTPLSIACLMPFVAIVAALLPGDIVVWLIPYFAVLPVIMIPGLESVQVLLLGRGTRQPTEAEYKRLQPLWDSVLSAWTSSHKSRSLRKGRFRLRVKDSELLNAEASGGCLVIVTTQCLTELKDSELKAVLAHELGHHIGLHSIILLAQNWLFEPVIWVRFFCLGVFRLSEWAREQARRSNEQLGFNLLIIVFLSLYCVLTSVLRLPSRALIFLGRHAEFQADKTAVALGYGGDLLAVLTTVHDGELAGHDYGADELDADPLADTHPPTLDRIERIIELMPDG